MATNIGAHSVGFCFHHYVLQLGRTSGAVAGTKVEKKLRVKVLQGPVFPKVALEKLIIDFMDLFQ